MHTNAPTTRKRQAIGDIHRLAHHAHVRCPVDFNRKPDIIYHRLASLVIEHDLARACNQFVVQHACTSGGDAAKPASKRDEYVYRFDFIAGSLAIMVKTWLDKYRRKPIGTIAEFAAIFTSDIHFEQA